VLHEYGEERYSRRIARVIVRERTQAPIATTRQLAELIAHAVPTRERGKDPATRCFQAIRIFINRELDELHAVLPQAVRALAPGGRLAVISFHSLEDRIVKRFLREAAKGGELPLELPLRASEIHACLRLVGKAVRASAAEVQRNPRARSAVLRVAERTEAAA
jgi:16S rRNA (cytosine1402-N4)-methyltransferase